ncbi:hypothetical protein Srot_1837 [Segniliparus rotundus DSM 44985]|uniref:Uncharacterized protein n=1 Tax=Segniliparus rotundus (strain ATCC BAA-972 / CDC 1076 / CIP 108378 / DSM 44985 / JCM 13578) TaxID=640132 RepID=D6Z8L7_SEGRD|nr:hypothetical protein [Segniliparus rotundus]ADG98297.1 hypothetical protein Srot_1837 [Segniliparus rotundus DSM 44985]
MNNRAFLRPRNVLFWVYATVAAAALFWRGPHELAGSGAALAIAWALLTCTGAAVIAVFGWTLDPHGVLPRSLPAAGFGWGAACGVLVARTDLQTHQLLVKTLGLAKGGMAAHWLAEPLAHDALAVLGTFLLLSLAKDRALRPTDGMKIGMSCGFGLWSGTLLVALSHGVLDDPAGGVAGALAKGLPHWFVLVAAAWAAPAAAGYGLGSAQVAFAHGRLRRFAVRAGAVLGSAVLACLQGGASATALSSEQGGWSWVWAASAGFGFAFAVLLPARERAWWTAIGVGAFGVFALVLARGPWPIAVLALFSPLAVLAVWRRATRPEGAWLSAALADETTDEVRTGCVDAGEIVDPRARRAAANCALDSFGPRAKPLVRRLRDGQIRLANSKDLLAAERKTAGAEPDTAWRTWLEHLEDEVRTRRAAIGATIAEMRLEKGVYQ